MSRHVPRRAIGDGIDRTNAGGLWKWTTDSQRKQQQAQQQPGTSALVQSTSDPPSGSRSAFQTTEPSTMGSQSSQLPRIGTQLLRMLSPRKGSSARYNVRDAPCCILNIQEDRTSGIQPIRCAGCWNIF